MSVTCMLQTMVDKESKASAQSVTLRLNSVFSDADKKREAAGFSEPSVDSIANFCDAVKQQRAQGSSAHRNSF